jgi:hypothetical protein
VVTDRLAQMSTGTPPISRVPANAIRIIAFRCRGHERSRLGRGSTIGQSR